MVRKWWLIVVAAALGCAFVFALIHSDDNSAPQYSCTGLNVSRGKGSAYQFAAQAAVTGGAKVKGFAWDFGDGAKGQTSATHPVVPHSYSTGGRYFVEVTAIIQRPDGRVVRVTGPYCQREIVVT